MVYAYMCIYVIIGCSRRCMLLIGCIIYIVYDVDIRIHDEGSIDEVLQKWVVVCCCVCVCVCVRERERAAVKFRSFPKTLAARQICGVSVLPC